MSADVPLVRQMLNAALDPSTSVTNLLRLARVASVKLGVGEGTKWIKEEMNGYPTTALEDLPTYRVVRGEPRYFLHDRGWLPVPLTNEKVADRLSTAYLLDPISVLEEFSITNNCGNLHALHNIQIQRYIISQVGPTDRTGIMLERAIMQGVINRFRDFVLNWALELEKAGAQGEGITFTLHEKATAMTVTNNYFAQNIGVAGHVEGGSSVRNEQVASAGLNLEAVRDLVEQLRRVAPALPAEAAARVEDLAAEVAKPAPDHGRLRTLLGSVRSVLEGAAGNLAALGAVEAIKRLLP